MILNYQGSTDHMKKAFCSCGSPNDSDALQTTSTPTSSTAAVILLSRRTLHQLFVKLRSNHLTLMEYDNEGEVVT